MALATRVHITAPTSFTSRKTSSTGVKPTTRAAVVGVAPVRSGRGRCATAVQASYTCGNGQSYYGPGPSPQAARRLMREMMDAFNGGAGAGGFAFPGGRVWFDMDMGGGACGSDAGAAAGAAPPPFRLAVDVEKEADAYVITADVPGVRKEDLTIKLQQGGGSGTGTNAGPNARPSLFVSGARTAGAEGGGAGELVARERRRGPFERRVTLPSDAATTGITARVRDGVLTVRVPRVAPPPQPADADIPIV